MEEEQDFNPNEMSNGFFTNPRNMYGSAITTLTNPENEVTKMELTFKNARMDSNNNITTTGKPLMNEYGINSIIGIVQSVMNQVTVMSNINKQEIPNLMEFLSDTLSRDLMINRVAYDIKSKASRDKIFFTALTSTYITLKRAYEEGDKRFWKGSVQEYRTTVENSGGNKGKGLLSRINPWSG